MKKKVKVVVGMSGGVDSSVAALLLKKKGFDVHGVFMINWQDSKNCKNLYENFHMAKSVCNILDIPLSTVNFSKEYYKKVFKYFINDIAEGYTPNPDIFCNSQIKFNVFLEHFINKGFDFIATGHYSNILQYNNEYKLIKSIDNKKDQSYFLYRLTQKQIARSIFPIGNYYKHEIKLLAKKHNFPNAYKKESMGICFIENKKFNLFLKKFFLIRKGNIKDINGNIIGTHKGTFYYTIGQRKGINIGGLKKYKKKPWFVYKKDVKKNEIIVVQDHKNPYLYSKTVIIKNIHFIRKISYPIKAYAKIRYQQKESLCIIYYKKVVFFEKQWSVTPGQHIVFYLNQECIGGAIITRSF